MKTLNTKRRPHLIKCCEDETACCRHSEKGSPVTRRAMEGGVESGSCGWSGRDGRVPKGAEASRGGGQEGEAGPGMACSRQGEMSCLEQRVPQVEGGECVCMCVRVCVRVCVCV